MNHILVIAEKPSVAKSIAAVIGAEKYENSFISGNGYLVSWCFGHLAELADPESYDERYAKWKRADLPIIPESWKYSVNADKKKQFDLLCSLMNRSDVSYIVNACDAGREGELIFRTVYRLANCTKPIKRLWISSMEDNAIREGFQNLRDGKAYENLYASALCRSKADWTVGINATRLFSVLYHRTLSVGRVVSPTLALIVQREAEINAFKSEPFYTVCLDFGAFTAVSERFKERTEAEKLLENCNSSVVSVSRAERKDKAEKAPALYDLTSLQRDANRILGYTAQQTLDYLQSLYEKKLTTYPRTDSRFLPDDMLSSVGDIVKRAAHIIGENPPEAMLPAQVCSSKKVSDHHAIVPTLSSEKQPLDLLPAGEREILKLIAKRTLIAVCEACRYQETVVTLECNSQVFTAKGKTVIHSGWKAYSENQNDKPLPDITENTSLTPEKAEIKEGRTTPPSRYTEDTLLAAMETAGAKEMPTDAERKGLGTPATRAAILERLIATGLAERQKNKKNVYLVPTHCGVSLITVLPEQLQSPLLTADWEQKLKEIERGERAPDDFTGEINEMVQEIIADYKVVPGADVLFPSGRPVIGKCPRCGGNVTESRNGFFCENDCRFALWKDNKYLANRKIQLTKSMAAALLKDGRAYVRGIYSEKTDKSYDAFIKLTDDGSRSLYSTDFSGKTENDR